MKPVGHFLFGISVMALAVVASGEVPAGSAIPEEAKPRTWWWWFGDTVTTNGITHDLEAMKEMGLGGASICANHWFGMEPGPVKCLSDEWYDMVVWAGKEADRLGLTLGFHNCPGWCNTGGPWVRPEFAQKHLVWTETRLEGGRRVDLALPKAKAPFGIYRQVAVLAIPDLEDAAVFEGALRDYVFERPRQVTSVEVTIDDFTYGRNFVSAPEYVVSVSEDGVNFREHWRTADTKAETVHTLTFPAVRAKALRLAVAKGETPKVVRVKVLAAPRIPHAQRKSYGSFVWEWPLVPSERFDCPSASAIPPEQVVDLTDRLEADGRLRWEAPAGKWIVLNFASTVMDYAINHVATPSGVGLECDKLSKAGVEEGARGPVTRIPELARKHGIRAFRTMHIDSSEAPAQNWTERMPEEFRALRGYDLRKFLPAMTGRYVGSAALSERFLRDFRYTVNDLMVRYWGGYYASLIRGQGLEFEFQAYNWPFNQLEMAQHADVPMGEFWIHTGFGSNDATKLAAEQADLYGRRIVSCEAFTDGCGKVMTDDNEDIADLRREGDRRFANGINRFVIHAYTHQPYDDPAMRTNYWTFGIRIDRHHPKFDSFKPWIAYLTETQAKLQVGRGVADAVVLMREDVSLDDTDWKIADPYGYRSNAIERKLFLSSLEFRDGRLRLPSGMEYSLLVLPDADEISPEVLKKTLALAEAGAEVLLGRRPSASPFLSGYPKCDGEVESFAKQLWDVCPEKGSARVGKGRVWRGVKSIDVYAALGLAPDFAATENGRPVNPDELVYTHRRTAELDRYFIANVTERAKDVRIRLRSGETRELHLEPSSSCFVDCPSAPCAGMTAPMSVPEVKCPSVQPISGRMTPETSRLFEKRVDAVSGVVSYALSGGERENRQSIYFTTKSMTDDGRFLVFDRSDNERFNPNESFFSRRKAVVDFLKDEIFDLPGADGNIPFIDAKEDYLVTTDARGFVRYDLREPSKPIRLCDFPEELLKLGKPRYWFTHLTLTTDRRKAFLDTCFEAPGVTNYVQGLLELATGRFEKWGQTYFFCNHGQLNPLRDDLALCAWEEVWTGAGAKRWQELGYCPRLWLMAPGGKQTLVRPVGDDNATHEIWDDDGRGFSWCRPGVCHYDLATGKSEVWCPDTRAIHGRITRDGRYVVYDRFDREWWRGCRWAVSFYDRETKRTVDVYSVRPALNPRDRQSRLHPDPHPHFVCGDRYVVSTAANAEGNMELFVTPVDQLKRMTAARK